MVSEPDGNDTGMFRNQLVNSGTGPGVWFIVEGREMRSLRSQGRAILRLPFGEDRNVYSTLHRQVAVVSASTIAASSARPAGGSHDSLLW